MALTGKLTALRVQKEKKPGLYGDGGGLFLQVTSPTAKSWIYRYRVGNKLRSVGLGSANAISLAEARHRAAICRNQRANGIDPLDRKREEKAKSRSAVTFDQCASAYIEAHRAGWKTEKQGIQWTNTLSAYASPIIGSMPVDQIDVHSILKILEPIWASKNETANRVRMRIESILDFAKVKGLRSSDNPAAWKGNLDHLLPDRNKVAPVKHLPALSYRDVPAFMNLLREQGSVSARALEFTIPTACSTSEVLGARWEEIDLEAKVWTVPASRMKMRREHRVPLSDRAMQILHEMQTILLDSGELVFPGQRQGKPLSTF